jgi:hypothetical protein
MELYEPTNFKKRKYDNVDNIDNTDNVDNIDNVDNVDNVDNIDNIDNVDKINLINKINNKRKYENNENKINKRVKYMHEVLSITKLKLDYCLDLTIVNKNNENNETLDIDTKLINQFNCLHLRKRKINYDIIDSNIVEDIENNSKYVCIYKCSVHDSDKNICTIYNCNGIYIKNGEELFMDYIN